MIRTAIARTCARTTTSSLSSSKTAMLSMTTRAIHVEYKDTQFNEVKETFDGTPAANVAAVSIAKWRESCAVIDSKVASLPQPVTIDPARYDNIKQFADVLTAPLASHTYPVFPVHRTADALKAEEAEHLASLATLDASLAVDKAQLDIALAKTRAEKAGVDTWTVAEALEDHPEWKEQIIEDVDEGNWF
jgi:hypothetical protein